MAQAHTQADDFDPDLGLFVSGESQMPVSHHVASCEMSLCQVAAIDNGDLIKRDLLN